jgi:hypothetical protein
MRFELTQRGSSWFLMKKNVNLTAVEEEWYAGDDKELAIRAMSKCNDHPTAVITSDDDCLRIVINDDSAREVFTIGYEGLVEPTVEEIKDIFEGTPAQLVTPPSNNLRQEVWLTTYKNYLAHPAYNRELACTEADRAVEHFDKLFTQKTIL